MPVIGPRASGLLRLGLSLGAAVLLGPGPARAATVAEWNPPNDVDEASFAATYVASVTASELTYPVGTLANIAFGGYYAVMKWPTLALDSTSPRRSPTSRAPRPWRRASACASSGSPRA